MHGYLKASVLGPALLLTVASGPAIGRDRGGDHRDAASKRRIVFTSTRTGESEIFAMNADGSEAVDLTNNPASGDSWPAVSRDGRKIAFSRGAGLAREIYVMNADGTGQRRITTNGAGEIGPAWSPDGRKIAVVRFAPPDFNFNIWIIDVDGAVPDFPLTSGPGVHVAPAWSPNGRWIAYSGDFEGFVAIYKVRADGSGPHRRLTPPDLQAGIPSWSPDGEAIAFSDNLCGTCDQSDLWILELGDGEMRRLTDTAENELFPSWSSDGKRITYERSDIVDGELLLPDVFVIDAKGGEGENLTRSPAVLDATPKFMPRIQHEGHDDDDDDHEHEQGR